jgi:hypothetical protein
MKSREDPIRRDYRISALRCPALIQSEPTPETLLNVCDGRRLLLLGEFKRSLHDSLCTLIQKVEAQVQRATRNQDGKRDRDCQSPNH